MHRGLRIKMARLAKGLTQQELAAKIHKTRPLISHIEQTGKVHPYTLKKIVEELDLTENDIYHVNENEKEYRKRAENMARESQNADGLLRIVDILERENEALRKLVKLQDEVIESLRMEPPSGKRKSKSAR
jgi:transcriptional regulator with XRE-family HTH domain